MTEDTFIFPNAYQAMSSIRDRIKALEAVDPPPTSAAPLSATLNKFETSQPASSSRLPITKTQESITAENNRGLGVAEAQRRILEKGGVDVGGVGKVVGRLEDEGRLGDVEGVRRRLEGLGRGKNGEGGVGRIVGTLEKGGRGDGVVKVASVFGKNGKVDGVESKEMPGKIKRVEKVESANAAGDVLHKERNMESSGIAARLKAFNGTVNNVNRPDHLQKSVPVKDQANISSVNARSSELSQKPNKTPQVSGETKQDVLKELAEIKKLNAELVSSIVQLTTAFKEVEANRDDLGKRLRALENKTR